MACTSGTGPNQETKYEKDLKTWKTARGAKTDLPNFHHQRQHPRRQMEQLPNEISPPKNPMKTTQTHHGVALVIVLGFLVLFSGLAIAFFSSVTTELGASRTYANNVCTRQLADSAVNMVMGQIREATARTGGAWASQPGMIRVYREGAGRSLGARRMRSSNSIRRGTWS